MVGGEFCPGPGVFVEVRLNGVFVGVVVGQCRMEQRRAQVRVPTHHVVDRCSRYGRRRHVVHRDPRPSQARAPLPVARVHHQQRANLSHSRRTHGSSVPASSTLDPHPRQPARTHVGVPTYGNCSVPPRTGLKQS